MRHEVVLMTHGQTAVVFDLSSMNVVNSPAQIDSLLSPLRSVLMHGCQLRWSYRLETGVKKQGVVLVIDALLVVCCCTVVVGVVVEANTLLTEALLLLVC